MRLYGFDHVPTTSPYPVLLWGRPGMGKRSWCIEQTKNFFAVVDVDTVDAESMTELSQRALTFGSHTSAIRIDLTGASTSEQNKLLALLEAPQGVAYFLHSDTRPIPTVVSRCATYHVPALPDADIENICLDAGMTAEQTRVCTAIAQGCPGVALNGLDKIRGTKRTYQALHVLTDDDPKALDDLCRAATRDDLDLLRDLIVEAETGRYVVWKQPETAPLVAVLPQLKYVLNHPSPLPHLAYTAIMYAARLFAR